MAIDTQRLLRVGKVRSTEQKLWLEGLSIERSANQSISDLQRRVSKARFALAKEMQRAVMLARRSRIPVHRSIVSRSYYCMYHAVRAAAYMFYLCDDHERHSDLPKMVPSDFPDSASWGNQLKSAREYRNQADYDPYPVTSRYWVQIAKSVETDANSLMPIVATYLRGKGCRV
jgi:uncharacterized protein (UPF0332 family)